MYLRHIDFCINKGDSGKVSRFIYETRKNKMRLCFNTHVKMLSEMLVHVKGNFELIYLTRLYNISFFKNKLV